MTDQTPQTTTEPVAWLMEDLILPSENITRDGVFAQRMAEYLYEGKPTYKVTPLYTTPQPLAIGLDREATDWETAADSLCGEMLKQAPGQVRKVADTLYETLLDTVQDYLRDNVGYNLSGELRRAKDNEAAANEALKSLALAMRVDVASFPHWPTPVMLSEQCVKKHSDSLALAAPADGWQGIDTAPKDGTHFLAYEDTGDIFRAAYHREGYLMCWGSQPVVQTPEPTHWMPLPAAPTGEGK